MYINKLHKVLKVCKKSAMFVCITFFHTLSNNINYFLFNSAFYSIKWIATRVVYFSVFSFRYETWDFNFKLVPNKMSIYEIRISMSFFQNTIFYHMSQNWDKNKFKITTFIFLCLLICGKNRRLFAPYK